jgi:hypothetical protein
MKVVIVVAFLVIVGALGYAGVSMLRGGRGGGARPGAMMRALALRVGVSVALFLLLLAAYKLGWIRPTGIPTGS